MLGQALDQALGDRRGIYRYGHAVVPMDEARAMCAIDISGRPYTLVSGFDRLPTGTINGFDYEEAEEFFRAVASAARLTLHIEIQAGTNGHHMVEACFKAFARALRGAVAIDPDETGVPSTKGTLTVVIAIADYGMGNRRSVEKALAHVGAAVRHHVRRPRRRARSSCPAWARSRRRCATWSAPAWASSWSSAPPPACRCSASASGCSCCSSPPTEHEGAARPRHPARHGDQAAVAAAAAHRLEPRARSSASRALTEGLGDAAAFYHVHSFACRPTDVADVVGESEYGERFVSVVERDNVMAAQFHPEKSSTDGLLMLKNFAALAAAVVA